MGPTKNPSAFRLNKKEISDIAEIAEAVEAAALQEGTATEEAKAMGDAKKRELTKQKQEERWQRSKDKHAAGLGIDQPEGDDGQEPADPQEPPPPVAAGGAGVGKPAEPRKSSGGAAPPTTNHNYYVKLGDAVRLILKHPFFKGILDADPIEISSDTAVSSGVQAHNPHASDCWQVPSVNHICEGLHIHTRREYIHHVYKGLSQQSIRHHCVNHLQCLLESHIIPA